MMSYVKNGTCYEKENISKCISDHAEQTTENGKMTSLDVIPQKRDMVLKRKFYQKVSLVMLNNFCHDQHCLKIKLRRRNRRLSKKITEKWQNYGCMTSYFKNGT